ncbi:MAG TPA: tetratricopeptide repeat protein [Elusimicrobiales bacterium]|nr:tetratricopeptide repeat protein [Elusimicrobiales bacterium]
MAFTNIVIRIYRFLAETRLTGDPERSKALRLFCWAALVGAVTLVVFLPAADNGFVNWDDQRNFLENMNFRGPGSQQLKWIWAAREAGFYIPVTRLANVLNYRLWGMFPQGYHLSGIFLHACCAVLVFLLNAALFGRLKPASRYVPPAAAFSALFFALHPLRVESAAWASGLHDPLSAIFYLLTVLSYIRLRTAVTPAGRVRCTLAGVIFFTLALLSKPTGLLLPLVLLFLDLHLFPAAGIKEKLRGALRGKLWLCLPILPAAAITLRSHQDVGSVYAFASYNAAHRLSQAMYNGVFYLWKTLLPFDLSPLYQLDLQLQPWHWPYWLTTPLFLGLTVAFILLARRGFTAGLSAWAAYLLLLAPVSGLAQTGYQVAADRYSYLSFLPWTLLVTGGLLGLKKLRPALLASCLAVLAALGFLTQRQTAAWRDSETLWRQALAVDPRSTYALDNLGDALADKGKTAEAIPYYAKAVIINPYFYEAHNDLATAYFETGRVAQAIRHFNMAVNINPGYLLAHHNLANIYFLALNRPEAAVFHYKKVTDLAPGNPVYQIELGRALFSAGRFGAALHRFNTALLLDPKNKFAAAAKAETAKRLSQAGERAGK